MFRDRSEATCETTDVRSPPTPLDPEIRRRYLGRLGLSAELPSVEALQRLHRRHVERVPYETMWIHSGEEWGIDPFDSAERIATQSRGGYCYHLNSAFAMLLRSLDYVVTDHVGGVHGPEGHSTDSVGNHLVLTVSGLPSNENPPGVWYVDVGLGDALYQALPLLPGTYQQEPFSLILDESEGQDWHLTHDPTGGFTGMQWTTAGASDYDFSAKHKWLSTSPTSGFVQVAMVERRDATGVDVVRGLVPSRIGKGARTGDAINNRSEWFALLADQFDLHFDASPPGTKDRLWDRVSAQHRVWQAAQL